MELENEKNIHYLHPDFEEDNENKEKKPSPLALLAQTCQSIGSGKDGKTGSNRDKSCSPNSASTSTRKSFKRSNSDYVSNCSESPSIDRVGSPPSKKAKPSSDMDQKIGRVELTHADTSSDLGQNLNQSLMNSFINFLKNSNNSQHTYTDKLEFLYFLTNRFMNSSPDNKPKDHSPPFHNGFHNLKNQMSVESHRFSEPDKPTNHNLESNNCYGKINSLVEPTQKSTSTIKYCMYCGKLIPQLPMLLAHIRFDHGGDHSPEVPPVQNFSTQMPSLCDFLMKFNPYQLQNQDKSSQPPPCVPTLSNYINNWSSLLGYENLIF